MPQAAVAALAPGVDAAAGGEAGRVGAATRYLHHLHARKGRDQAGPVVAPVLLRKIHCHLFNLQ